MATIKIASLLLKTLAKPLSVQLKNQAKEHPRFREITISIAQQLHKREMNMRINLLGDKMNPHIKPLNEAKAIEQGSNFISEAFLFLFAASLIGAETYRSRRSEANRRDLVRERIDELEERAIEAEKKEEKTRNDLLETRDNLKRVESIVELIADIGYKGGWLPRTTSDAWRARSGVEYPADESVLDGSVLKELLRGMNS